MACIVTDENLNIVAEVHNELNNSEVVMDNSWGQQMTQIIMTNMLNAGTAEFLSYNYYRVTYRCAIDCNNLRLSLLFVETIKQSNFVTEPYRL